MSPTVLRHFCHAISGREAAATLILCATGAPAAAQTIEELSPLPGSTNYAVRGLSANGQVSVGFCSYLQPERNYPVRWLGTQLEPLGSFGSHNISLATAISADAGRVAGQGIVWPTFQAFVWDGAFAALATMPGYDNASVKGMSADGLVTVGTYYATSPQTSRAVLWSQGTITDLGVLTGMTSSVGAGVSADGATVVGNSSHTTQTTPPVTTSRAFRWTQATGMVDLGLLPATSNASATAISSDGSIIVGTCTGGGLSTYRSFRWTQQGGLQPLQIPPGTSWTTATAISPDGSVIVGKASFRPYLWLPAGPVDLNDFLPTQGVNLAGWNLTECIAISADRTVLVGHGTFNGAHRAWIVRDIPPLGASCYPNCDDSTIPPILNIADFACFLQKFAAGEPYANCDQSTQQPTLNIADFACFLTKFAAGCN